ncbi:GNAT superfamily N-acetyltransferase [Kibdelosporangium banguiense]|uniref:GNAT superfamily N-acetyltransferase n=1 Tax=Kibdelosporangium banguiense TaxID=1365924 RepID=A0ABS4TAU7_9PSEU|nr:GNAT family N-acetyltransferase [Kibdelosporangium banguiense]MBP2321541.1 GNAT superfamily N-acetyltransferase [Kibdelosporangium banguiense]
MKFRQATMDDIDLLADWRWEVSAWIHEKGSDQWDITGLSREEFERRITRSIKAGETWLALDDNDRPVGTIAIDVVGDEGLWADEELGESYVIHRMMVPRAYSGRGVGVAMMKFAEDLARSHGRRKLVLDAWNTNKELHSYYESFGFRRVRTVSNHWTPSATLFEKLVPNFDPTAKGPDKTPIQFRDQGR